MHVIVKVYQGWHFVYLTLSLLQCFKILFTCLWSIFIGFPTENVNKFQFVLQLKITQLRTKTITPLAGQ